MKNPALFLWIFAIVLDGALIALAIWRKRQSLMPYFFAYVTCLGLRDVALFAVYRLTAPKYMPYFVSYWISDIGIVLLRFLMLREICLDVIRGWPGAFAGALRAFRGAALVLVFIALASGIAAHGAGPDRLIAGIQVLRRSVLLFEAGLLLSLLAITAYVGVNWKRFTFGAAFGLGIYAALQIPITTLAAEYGDVVQRVFVVLNTGAYIAALMVWIAFCAMPTDDELDLPMSTFSFVTSGEALRMSADTEATHLTILELLRK